MANPSVVSHRKGPTTSWTGLGDEGEDLRAVRRWGPRGRGGRRGPGDRDGAGDEGDRRRGGAQRVTGLVLARAPRGGGDRPGPHRLRSGGPGIGPGAVRRGFPRGPSSPPLPRPHGRDPLPQETG